MSDEKKPAVKVEDMDQPAEELTPEQAEKAQGGFSWLSIGTSVIYGATAGIQDRSLQRALDFKKAMDDM